MREAWSVAQEEVEKEEDPHMKKLQRKVKHIKILPQAHLPTK